MNDEGQEATMTQTEPKDIVIAVATHKAYRMPTDPVYMPLHVGKALHPELDLGFAGDDTGDNISELNASYSELTGLYWLWKNCDATYKGLAHYRRHFGTPDAVKRLTERDRFARIATYGDIAPLAERAGIIVPRKRHYYIETIRSHYAHTFDGYQLDVTRSVLESMHPECMPAFDAVMNSRSAHLFNMFVMRADLFDEYCAWLFPVLEQLVGQMPPQQYDVFNARYPGRISEMLLDVWLLTTGYRYEELPVVSTEPVNWWKKGASFLLAKFVGKKYEKSF